MIGLTFLEMFNEDLRPPPAAARRFVTTSYEAAANEEPTGENLQTSTNV